MTWAPMMAAMMLPSAAPAIMRRAREPGGALAAPLFAASYLGLWLLAGLAVCAVYQPPGDLAAGALVAAGGAYELTPLKRACRARCHERLRSGLRLGLWCLGSSLGLMLVLAGVGLMSGAWMCAVALVVLVQKLVPPRRGLDVPLALALVALALTLV